MKISNPNAFIFNSNRQSVFTHIQIFDSSSPTFCFLRTQTHTETQSQLQFHFILHCTDLGLKAHARTRTHKQHTPKSLHCTVCCLLSTIQRTNQLITASVHRNPIPSKGHLSIQRFSFFPVLSHPLLFILVICYFLKSIPFALFPPLPLYYYFFLWGRGDFGLNLICPCLGSLSPFPSHTLHHSRQEVLGW